MTAAAGRQARGERPAGGKVRIIYLSCGCVRWHDLPEDSTHCPACGFAGAGVARTGTAAVDAR